MNRNLAPFRRAAAFQEVEGLARPGAVGRTAWNAPCQAGHGCARIPLWAAHGVCSRRHTGDIVDVV